MGAWQVSKILPAAAAAEAASPKTGIAVFAENKRKTSKAVTSEGLASMRPSSQEAYASSGPRSPATHTSASATHPALGGSARGSVALGGFLMLMCVSLVILAQRRHMLLEMRVSWMLILLR